MTFDENDVASLAALSASSLAYSFLLHHVADKKKQKRKKKENTLRYVKNTILKRHCPKIQVPRVIFIYILKAPLWNNIPTSCSDIVIHIKNILFHRREDIHLPWDFLSQLKRFLDIFFSFLFFPSSTPFANPAAFARKRGGRAGFWRKTRTRTMGRRIG